MEKIKENGRLYWTRSIRFSGLIEIDLAWVSIVGGKAFDKVKVTRLKVL